MKKFYGKKLKESMRYIFEVPTKEELMNHPDFVEVDDNGGDYCPIIVMKHSKIWEQDCGRVFEFRTCGGKPVEIAYTDQYDEGGRCKEPDDLTRDGNISKYFYLIEEQKMIELIDDSFSYLAFDGKVFLDEEYNIVNPKKVFDFIDKVNKAKRKTKVLEKNSEK